MLKVAPHRGAWIEISNSGAGRGDGDVAPHRGAWIEIKDYDDEILIGECRTPQGCVD